VRTRTEATLSLVAPGKGEAVAIAGEPRRAGGHFTTVGTPEQTADLIENWFVGGAADGFNIMPPLLPADVDVFSAEVIPLLQRRVCSRRHRGGYQHPHRRFRR
jgi:alkanesulfonate monooxygenase SsuD/methylene tetrahydromethanopterin reductase-like flavin-dependent oxidoreductase (luciferase family)